MRQCAESGAVKKRAASNPRIQSSISVLSNGSISLAIFMRVADGQFAAAVLRNQHMNSQTVKPRDSSGDPAAKRGQARAVLKRGIMAERQPGGQHRADPPARRQRGSDLIIWSLQRTRPHSLNCSAKSNSKLVARTDPQSRRPTIARVPAIHLRHRDGGDRAAEVKVDTEADARATPAGRATTSRGSTHISAGAPEREPKSSGLTTGDRCPTCCGREQFDRLAVAASTHGQTRGGPGPRLHGRPGAASQSARATGRRTPARRARSPGSRSRAGAAARTVGRSARACRNCGPRPPMRGRFRSKTTTRRPRLASWYA